MSDASRVFATRLENLDRSSAIAILAEQPELTLEQLNELLESPEIGSRLRGITVGELCYFGRLRDELAGASEPAAVAYRELAGARARAELLVGLGFDDLVCNVINELSQGGKLVTPADLRSRVGGPRWKVASSLQRLLTSGQILKFGRTNGTRYATAASQPASPPASPPASQPASPQLGWLS